MKEKGFYIKADFNI